MPANPQYLTMSKWQRFAKISAGLLGGYLLASVIHMILALWLFNHRVVLVTSVYSLFILWVVFMIVPFLVKNGWKIWGIYLIGILLGAVAIHFGQMYHSVI